MSTVNAEQVLYDLGYSHNEQIEVGRLLSQSTLPISLGEIPFRHSKQGEALVREAKNYREQIRMHEEYCRDRYG